MESAKLTTAKSPFDMSEIRSMIATYLSPSDAIACSLVCKAWSEDFISNIWHSVNFMTHTKFKDLDPKIIAKHGKHIRVVVSLDQKSELVALQDSSVCNLRIIGVALPSASVFRLYFVGLIRRNRNTITNLELTAESTDMDFESVDALVPNMPPNKSSLASVTLKNLRMTRDSLSTLLSACSVLNDISIEGCTSLSSRNSDLQQNLHVTKFCAPIRQILDPHPSRPTASLLVHFPNLKIWDDLSGESNLTDTDAESIQEELTKYCPNVVAVGTYTSPSPAVQKLLSVITQSLEKIQFSYEAISPGVIESILFHKSTLLSVEAYAPAITNWEYDADKVFGVEDSFSESDLSWMFQIVPMTCSRLEVIILPSYEMDMDVVERMPWVCTDLRVLKVRVQGLEPRNLFLL
ncbi:hypothetical protein BGX26_008967 [Mortierella sp. AD094]|nr:hypothetical protein BGX26_008967 [Mortierella sp. AD094]